MSVIAIAVVIIIYGYTIPTLFENPHEPQVKLKMTISLNCPDGFVDKVIQREGKSIQTCVALA